VNAIDDQSSDWASRVLASLAPLRETAARSSVTLSEVAADDLAAINDAAARLTDIIALNNSEARHDRLNLIGAIKGYAEMLYEDRDQLHPAIVTSLEPLLAAVQAQTATESQQATFNNSDEEPGFILAVDDAPENRDLISRLLGKAGHTVITAESGQEALDLLETQAVDMVLLDLMMPGIGGAEVLTFMKSDERLRATPVIMISGRQDMDQIVACIQAGADDYLLKPFNPVLLQARISAGIERKRWHDREERYREQLERSERFIRATFGRYLSDDIVKEILENPEGLKLGGDLREVTIMMSDIRGFTSLSESLPPEQVVALLNRYLGRMTEIILDYRGTIDEFLGDAVLAVFGAPRSEGNDAQRAADCALAMQAAMAEINAANVADGLPELEMAIALNTGKVVAGNIGSERRSKYGFVGHEMNVTSRIEDVTGAGEILISDNTRQHLSKDYETGESRSVSAKGIGEQLVVYPLIGGAT